MVKWIINQYTCAHSIKNPPASCFSCLINNLNKQKQKEYQKIHRKYWFTSISFHEYRYCLHLISRMNCLMVSLYPEYAAFSFGKNRHLLLDDRIPGFVQPSEGKNSWVCESSVWESHIGDTHGLYISNTSRMAGIVGLFCRLSLCENRCPAWISYRMHGAHSRLDTNRAMLINVVFLLVCCRYCCS